jgi:hypothetical protein
VHRPPAKPPVAGVQVSESQGAGRRRAGPAAESEGEHCGGDLAGRGVPQGGAHVVEDEQRLYYSS